MFLKHNQLPAFILALSSPVYPRLHSTDAALSFWVKSLKSDAQIRIINPESRPQLSCANDDAVADYGLLPVFFSPPLLSSFFSLAAEYFIDSVKVNAPKQIYIMPL